MKTGREPSATFAKKIDARNNNSSVARTLGPAVRSMKYCLRAPLFLKPRTPRLEIVDRSHLPNLLHRKIRLLINWLSSETR